MSCVQCHVGIRNPCRTHGAQDLLSALFSALGKELVHHTHEDSLTGDFLQLASRLQSRALKLVTEGQSFKALWQLKVFQGLIELMAKVQALETAG